MCTPLCRFNPCPAQIVWVDTSSCRAAMFAAGLGWSAGGWGCASDISSCASAFLMTELRCSGDTSCTGVINPAPGRSRGGLCGLDDGVRCSLRPCGTQLFPSNVPCLSCWCCRRGCTLPDFKVIGGMEITVMMADDPVVARRWGASGVCILGALMRWYGLVLGNGRVDPLFRRCSLSFAKSAVRRALNVQSSTSNVLLDVR